MLQEILLSLSGHPSPLFEDSVDKSHLGSNPDFPLLSPPEKALLDSLANLSNLHKQIRSTTSTISSSHPSTICRAVAGTIASNHLGRFQQKILEVERSILESDAAYVGGYGIVPLSTIVGEFSGWTRRMEWLWRIVQFMAVKGKEDDMARSTGVCTGPSLINHLQREHVQTGYVEIEELARDLVQAAEMAWLRQLSAWILYGKLPSFGAEDFFIQEQSPKNDERIPEVKDFCIQDDLLPNFVTPTSASSTLFIGKSLYHLRITSLASESDKAPSSTPSEAALLSMHLQTLSAISSPITSASFAQIVDSIRRSLSQNVLSQLLSARKIMELLSVLQRFLLLDKGEFAVALINRADEQVRLRHRKSNRERSTKRGQGPLEGISIKEGEMNTVLTRVLADLSSLQDEDDPGDDDLEIAQDLLRLSLGGPKTQRGNLAGANPQQRDESRQTLFNDFLFPIPTKLSIRVLPPLDLFLHAEDLDTYSSVNGYLLSIRRAHLRLTELWKQTSLRREHPAPLGPPLSNSKSGGDLLLRRRKRSNERVILMRRFWATTGAVLFLLSELGGYLQGEVVNGHWNHFRRWLGGQTSPSQSTSGSRPGTASTMGETPGFASLNSSLSFPGGHVSTTFAHRDPETLTLAHRTYLSALLRSLLLDDTSFTVALRSFLSQVDHLIALFTRLQTVQQNLDLEMDEGVVDALADPVSEEKEIMTSLLESRKELDDSLRGLVDRLREVEERRHGYGVEATKSKLLEEEAYIPWKGPGVDRLLMKLDFVRSDETLGEAGDLA